MRSSFKSTLITGLVIVALIILGAALINTGKISKQKQQAAIGAGALAGKPLPEIELRDRDRNVYPMASLRGKTVVLFFNEGLMCYPACWDQMAAFGADPRFNGSDVAVLSIVTDSPQDWQTAVAKMPELAGAATLFDAGAAVSRRLGLLSEGSSMHAGQLPGHTYILVDKQGVVREVFDDANMAVNNDLLMEKISKF